jgi:hypothetical protein
LSGVALNIEHERFHDVESQGPSYGHQTRGAIEFRKSRSPRLRRDAVYRDGNRFLSAAAGLAHNWHTGFPRSGKLQIPTGSQSLDL